MTTLRLILGDQLNPTHSWFSAPDDSAVFVLMEIREETNYILHHAQKIIAIFASMRDFARQIRALGHRVHYIAIDDPANRQSFPANLDALIAEYSACAFEYQAPDEWRLDRQLADYASKIANHRAIHARMVDSEHFYTDRNEAAQFFAEHKQWRMEHFYRKMRIRHGVLMAGLGKPLGGQWNFDQENRKAWPGLPREPADWRSEHDHSALWESIQQSGVASFGQPNAQHFLWPLNRYEALQQLDDFIAEALPHFGDYQDALTHRSWRLFHSLLSFALNTKMLNPRELVSKAVEAYESNRVPLAAVEGFIRQILGWREYMRGVYWLNMPGYAAQNYFGHQRPLPSWFWTGETKMRCLAHAIGQSLEHAYAHHIQRLMVIGNFALLAGLNPAAVHGWYLGVYIDAFEWVELPNTVGMSQFADGGKLATKPYVSSAAYIDRMGDYCKGCHYDSKARVGTQSCPFNALYWDFFARNGERLSTNPRLGIVYRQLDKMNPEALAAAQGKADRIRAEIDNL